MSSASSQGGPYGSIFYRRLGMILGEINMTGDPADGESDKPTVRLRVRFQGSSYRAGLLLSGR
jgi:hypothetical protein